MSDLLIKGWLLASQFNFNYMLRLIVLRVSPSPLTQHSALSVLLKTFPHPHPRQRTSPAGTQLQPL